MGAGAKYFMFNRLTRVTAPTDSILDVNDVKDHLRVDGDDNLVARLIDVATAHIEGPNGAGIALLTQTWRLSLDCLTPCISLLMGPVTGVTSVTYTDYSGNVQTLDPSLYTVDVDHQPARIARKPFAVYPPDLGGAGSVKVTFTCGYGTADDVPADLKHAALLLIGHFYENREATTSASSITKLPLGYESIIARYAAVALA